MDALLQEPLSPTVQTLNQTEISRLATQALEQGKVEIWPPVLALVQLLEWALENLAIDRDWADRVRDAVVLAAEDDPQATYNNLAQARLEPGQTLQQAAQAMLSMAVDLIPPPKQRPVE